MKKFTGIYPALLTPFDKNGQINRGVLRELVEMNIQKGVSGFYVCGSTAEAFLLSSEQRKEILETVAAQNNGRVQLLAHVGHIDTLTAIDLARHAAALGVDAVSAVAPFYYHFTFEEIKRYYFDIADAVDRPMIVYNFPAFSGVNLSEDNLAEFFADARFAALKHTSSDFFLLERMSRRFPDRSFLNGYDEMFLSGLAAGADGAVGSTYNFMAEKFIRIRALFQQNRMAEALEEQRRANNILSALRREGLMAGEKAILCGLGLDFGTARRPFHALTQEQTDLLMRVYRENT